MATTYYRYLFADLLTNNIIGELPITNVNFTQQLNAAGTLTGDLLLSGVQSASLNVLNSTIPGKCAVYVDRAGTLVWGGIVWGREWNSASQHLKITAREFESYFERRRITTTQSFFSQDQLTIAQSLITAAQAVTGGNIGVIVPSNTSGVIVNQQIYYNYELKTYFSAIADLAKATNGFDFNIKVAYDGGGNPTKTLQLGYPRLGNTYSATSTTVPVFMIPAGNIVEYNYKEDGTKAANTIYLTGAGSNEGKLLVTGTDATKLAAGWPLLEDSVNYSNITDSNLLQNMATGQVSVVSYPPQTIQIIAPPYLDPVYGSYSLGDQARVIVKDDFYPAGFDGNYRIIALNVTPGENNRPEQVTLTLTTTSN
jgi:hypothetical protein